MQDDKRHHLVQLRAYSFWEKRGQPWGTPETDWFKAEEELQASDHKPPAIAAARMVGALLGSVAGFVTSVADSRAPE